MTQETREDPNQDSKTFVVELTKHTSNLGLSITGGTDTESKEIRIKSVKVRIAHKLFHFDVLNRVLQIDNCQFEPVGRFANCTFFHGVLFLL